MLSNKKILKLLFSVYFVVQFNAKYVPAQSRTNFDTIKFEQCATDGRVKYSMNITKISNKPFFDFYMNSPIALDENVGMKWSIDSSLDGRTFLPLYTIREKDFCKAMNKYMGEFWYDIERAAQMPPGVCPIQAGKYQIHHHPLNFKLMSLQTFPFGTLRMIIRSIDKRTNTVLTCTLLLINNVEN